MKRALVFSGQGSQYVGMARDLTHDHAAAREIVAKADAILGYGLSSIMFDGPSETLTETRHTQPALFVHEAAILAVTNAHREADAVAGHSLGEYTALYAAGVLSFEDALRLVQLRAALMFESGTKVPGTMAAVVGMDDDAVRALCASLDGVDGQRLVAANFNSPGQVVISGSADYLRASLPRFKEAGAKIVKELQVSGAFHSPLLAEAQRPLAERMLATTFHDASIPVYVNVAGEPKTSADALREAAIAQLTAPVLWTQTLHRMWADGVTTFTEIGPGKVLQGLVKRTLAEATIDGIDNSADIARIMGAGA